MKQFLKYSLVFLLLAGAMSSCQTASKNSSEESELSTDGSAAADDSAVAESDNGASAADSSATASTEAANGEVDEFAEFDNANDGTNSKDQAANSAEPLTPEETTPPPPPTENAEAKNEPLNTPPPVPVEEPQQEAQAPVQEPPPMVETNTESPANITSLQYKRNETGGTVVVEADKPLAFTTRMNKDLNQLVVEVQNAVLPQKLTRPLNTKDFEGTIGQVTAYEDKATTTARFVIQLRSGAEEPFVGQEGNSLLITANDANGGPQIQAKNQGAEQSSADSTSTAPAQPEKALQNKTLAEFLSSTQEFYGRRISIETNDMDIRDALRFLSEESGINMVVSDGVNGHVGLKLRQVPWDQALVVIMRARNLGYIRQGNILRIAPLTELQAEEINLMQLQVSRRQMEPTSIRVFRLSYANATSLATTISSLLNPAPATGAAAATAAAATAPNSSSSKPNVQVVADSTSNSLIVTATKDDLERVSRIVNNFDTPPPQVLIEGKIVEASEGFTRNVGVSWSSAGGSAILGRAINGPIYAQPSLSSGAGAGRGTQSTYMNFKLDIGTLDILGDLSAILSLDESENRVKILSSPKLVTLAGKPAKIEAVHQLPQRTTTTQANVGTVQTTTGVDSKISLDVTPLVTADNSVNLKISVQRDIPQVVASDGTILKDSRSASSEVLVKNGQTAVLGGIYQTDESEGVSGVPGLKDLPVLGYLFKGKSTIKTKNELLIFVTPRIISGGDASTSATVSKDL